MQLVSYASNHSILLIIHVWINPFHFSEIRNYTYSSMQTHGFHLFIWLNKVTAVQRERHNEWGREIMGKCMTWVKISHQFLPLRSKYSQVFRQETGRHIFSTEW
jgi:hypothetical protein